MFIYYPSCFNQITEAEDLWFPSLTNKPSLWITRYRFPKEKFPSVWCRAEKYTKLMMSSLAKITQKIFIFFNPTKLIRITLRLLSVLWAHITWFRFAQRLQFITLEHTRNSSRKCKRINNGWLLLNVTSLKLGLMRCMFHIEHPRGRKGLAKIWI